MRSRCRGRARFAPCDARANRLGAALSQARSNCHDGSRTHSALSRAVQSARACKRRALGIPDSTQLAATRRCASPRRQARRGDRGLRRDPRAEPRNAHALHYSGVAYYQTGDLKASLRAPARVGEPRRQQAPTRGRTSASCCRRSASRARRSRCSSARRSSILSSDEILTNLARARKPADSTRGRGDRARRARDANRRSPRRGSCWRSRCSRRGACWRRSRRPRGRRGSHPTRRASPASRRSSRTASARRKGRARRSDKALARKPMSVGAALRARRRLEYKLARPARGGRRRTSRSSGSIRAHGPRCRSSTFLRGRLADWHGRAALSALPASAVAAGAPALSPFAFLSLPSSRAEQRRCARTWTAPLAGLTQPVTRACGSLGGPLRIGYLSADFHSHATAFLAAGLFEQHDRSRFEVVAYSTGPDDRSRDARSAWCGHSTASSTSATATRCRSPNMIQRDRDRHPGRPQGPHAGCACRSCSRGVQRRSRCTTWAIPERSSGGLVDYLIGDPIVTPREHLRGLRGSDRDRCPTPTR